jgi:hypothetical protein
MSTKVKVTMLLCSGLTPAEQEKVERLDGEIAYRISQAGANARICEGRGTGNQRVLEFFGPEGLNGRVSASDFLSASDRDAVAGIVFFNS